MCILVSSLYGFVLGLCKGGCVYVHDILCMTMLIVTTKETKTLASRAADQSKSRSNISRVLG